MDDVLDFSLDGDFELSGQPVAYIEKESGKRHVVGVCSDDLVDDGFDRVSKRALGMLAKDAKSGVPLLPTHRDTFGFGTSVSAAVKSMDRDDGESGKKNALVVDWVLDDAYPQSATLFDAVKNQKDPKTFQSSIGAFIVREDPKAVYYEELPNGMLVRVLNAMKLDHVATTRKGHAMNSRTSWSKAVVKDLDQIDPQSLFVLRSNGSWLEPGRFQDEGLYLPGTVLGAVIHKGASSCADPNSAWGEERETRLALLEKGGLVALREAVAWEDKSAIEGSPDRYALLHHGLIEGELRTNLDAVVKSAAAFLGATAGPDVPSRDRVQVGKHLAAHYREFGHEPPPQLERGDHLTLDLFKSHHEAHGIPVRFLRGGKENTTMTKKTSIDVLTSLLEKANEQRAEGEAVADTLADLASVLAANPVLANAVRGDRRYQGLLKMLESDEPAEAPAEPAAAAPAEPVEEPVETPAEPVPAEPTPAPAAETPAEPAPAEPAAAAPAEPVEEPVEASAEGAPEEKDQLFEQIVNAAAQAAASAIGEQLAPLLKAVTDRLDQTDATVAALLKSRVRQSNQVVERGRPDPVPVAPQRREDSFAPLLRSTLNQTALSGHRRR